MTFEIDEVELAGRGICKLYPPLKLDVCFDNETGNYVVSDAKFKLFADAHSFDVARMEIVKGLQFLFREYVDEDIEKLTRGAVKLRGRLLDSLVEK